MKNNNSLRRILFASLLGSLCANASAEITVDKSNGVLAITSDISGIVRAKVIAPDNEVVVNESYSGSSFSWTPSGPDGAYRYDVRVFPEVYNDNNTGTDKLAELASSPTLKSDYAGGSVEVKNGQMAMAEEEIK